MIEDRLAAMEYWEQRVHRLRPQADKLRGNGRVLYERIQDWASSLQEILDEIVDLLHPIGYEAIEANHFHMLRQMLERGRNLP